MNDLIRRHNEETKENRRSFDNEIAALKKKHQEELDRLRREMEQDKENLSRRKDEEKEEAIARLTKEYEDKMQRLSNNFDRQLNNKIEEYEEKLSLKEKEIAALKKEFERAKDELNNQLNSVTREREDAKKKIEEYKKKCEGLHDRVKEIEATIADIQERADRRVWEVEKQMERTEQLFKSKEIELRSSLKAEREALIHEQMDYAAQMQAELDEIKRIGEEKVRALIEKYNELNKVFEQRPSRPEDLELIQHLEKDNAFKEAELFKALENLKVFKLELINREESYNKMFNTNPLVGVFNVLDNKVIRIFNSKMFSNFYHRDPEEMAPQCPRLELCLQ